MCVGYEFWFCPLLLASQLICCWSVGLPSVTSGLKGVGAVVGLDDRVEDCRH